MKAFSGRIQSWLEDLDPRYNLNDIEIDDDSVAEWAGQIPDVRGDQGFPDIVGEYRNIVEDFYSEADMEIDVFAYNLGIAAGKADHDFSLEDYNIRALRESLGNLARDREEYGRKIDSFFDFGVDDFSELRDEYGL